jgi:transcriptional regulator with XRE-family HTH domain
MRKIGNVIMRRRKELNWTQADLGQKLGVSKSYISQIESGFRTINNEKLELLSLILGICFSEYTNMENELLNKWKNVINKFEDHAITPEEVEMLIGFISHLKAGSGDKYVSAV